MIISKGQIKVVTMDHLFYIIQEILLNKSFSRSHFFNLFLTLIKGRKSEILKQFLAGKKNIFNFIFYDRNESAYKLLSSRIYQNTSHFHTLSQMTTKLKRQIWKCNKTIENKEVLNLEDFMEKVFLNSSL